MSLLPNTLLVDQSGRPPQDAAVQNFKSYSTLIGNQTSGQEASFGGAVIGDLIVDNGAFNNLVVDTLTVTGASPTSEPSSVTLQPFIAVAGADASVVLSGYPEFKFTTNLTDTITWADVNVPASTTRAIRIYTAGAASSALEVLVNGVSVGTLDTVSAGLYTTPTFDWPGGAMTVVISQTAAAIAVNLFGAPLVI